jgi:hypothetical protein
MGEILRYPAQRNLNGGNVNEHRTEIGWESHEYLYIFYSLVCTSLIPILSILVRSSLDARFT